MLGRLEFLLKFGFRASDFHSKMLVPPNKTQKSKEGLIPSSMRTYVRKYAYGYAEF